MKCAPVWRSARTSSTLQWLVVLFNRRLDTKIQIIWITGKKITKKFRHQVKNCKKYKICTYIIIYLFTARDTLSTHIRNCRRISCRHIRKGFISFDRQTQEIIWSQRHVSNCRFWNVREDTVQCYFSVLLHHNFVFIITCYGPVGVLLSDIGSRE